MSKWQPIDRSDTQPSATGWDLRFARLGTAMLISLHHDYHIDMRFHGDRCRVSLSHCRASCTVRGSESLWLSLRYAPHVRHCTSGHRISNCARICGTHLHDSRTVYRLSICLSLSSYTRIVLRPSRACVVVSMPCGRSRDGIR